MSGSMCFIRSSRRKRGFGGEKKLRTVLWHCRARLATVAKHPFGKFPAVTVTVSTKGMDKNGGWTYKSKLKFSF